jgi:hypothetical protein
MYYINIGAINRKSHNAFEMAPQCGSTEHDIRDFRPLLPVKCPGVLTLSTSRKVLLDCGRYPFILLKSLKDFALKIQKGEVVQDIMMNVICDHVLR